jgi:hypothetical protein
MDRDRHHKEPDARHLLPIRTFVTFQKVLVRSEVVDKVHRKGSQTESNQKTPETSGFYRRLNQAEGAGGQHDSGREAEQGVDHAFVSALTEEEKG